MLTLVLCPAMTTERFMTADFMACSPCAAHYQHCTVLNCGFGIKLPSDKFIAKFFGDDFTHTIPLPDARFHCVHAAAPRPVNFLLQFFDVSTKPGLGGPSIMGIGCQLGQ
jgi:hypothetical protein